jgi:hypothetical protein
MAVAGSRIAAMFEPVVQGGQPVQGDGLVIVGAALGGEEPEAGGAAAQLLEERQATKALLEEMGEDTRGIDAELAEITAEVELWSGQEIWHALRRRPRSTKTAKTCRR